MCNRLGLRRTTGLQHLFDEVDAPARPIVFIVQQRISGAARGAKAIVLAGFENLIRFSNIRIGQLMQSELGMHIELCSDVVQILKASPHGVLAKSAK